MHDESQGVRTCAVFRESLPEPAPKRTVDGPASESGVGVGGEGLLGLPPFLQVSRGWGEVRWGGGCSKHLRRVGKPRSSCICICMNRYVLASNCSLTPICSPNQFVLQGNEASYTSVIKTNCVILGVSFFFFSFERRARLCLADKGTGLELKIGNSNSREFLIGQKRW